MAIPDRPIVQRGRPAPNVQQAQDQDQDQAHDQVQEQDQDQEESVMSRLLVVILVLVLRVVLQEVTSCEAPIVVLHNRYGTMSPTLSSGDMLFLTNYPDDPITVGDIVSVKFPGEDTPWVRRVVDVAPTNAGDLIYLTKGDNIQNDNTVVTGGPAVPLALSMAWVTKELIVGKMSMNVPLVGIPGLILNSDTPHSTFLWFILLGYPMVEGLYKKIKHRLAG
ncbi:signal peptidase complex catalytic subunit SEC11A-like [Branchiostoma lanceolatum]|uniref:signal peptidase complex catalytic subunit SEC11A-like n=1 Tax=Branchiostoma lanceolatum TaxID=7740 RepID=UPI003456A3D4